MKNILHLSLKTFLVLCTILIGVITNQVTAQTTLDVGDIAFTSYASDGQDTFSIVILKDIVSGTSIVFTDGEWVSASGVFQINGSSNGYSENFFEWQSTASMSVGDEVKFYRPSVGVREIASVGSVVRGRSLSLTSAGDQIHAIQGATYDTSGTDWSVHINTVTPTRFLSSIHANYISGTTTTSNWDGVSASATIPTATELPSALTNGTNAIWVYDSGPTESDNHALKCSALPLSGGASTIRSTCNNVSNWDHDDGSPIPWPRNDCGPTCTMTASITSQTNVDCNGASTGSLTVTQSDGTANFDYAWSNGSSTSNSSSSTNTINSLAAGTYTVTITDDNACTATASATITQPAAALVSSASVSQALDCNGDTDGQVLASGSGGTPSYTYSWNTGGTSATETGLGAGTYSVTITDANGCTDSASIALTEPTALVSSASVSQALDCNGDTDGQVLASGSGGTPSYTYSWNTGGTSATETGLGAGTYSVTITDANGCTDSASIALTEPTALVAAAVADSNASCNGFSDAGATVGASGGTPSYTYSWNTGATTASITGVAAGTYSVTITDANGCTDSASVTLTEPASLVAAGVVDSNVTCNGFSDGGGTAAASGGTPAYSYLWSNAATNASITGVMAGTYSVTITDANGCTDSASIIVTEPASLVASAVVDSNETCATGNDGGLTASGTGGTMAYSYLWSNAATTASITGVTAGTYSVTITDANGCTDSASATVTQNAQTSYKDVDGDGYSDGVTSSLCPPPTNFYFAGDLTATSGDCKDTLANVNPGMPELPGNGIDDNCDTQTDDVPCSLPTGFSTSGISYDRATLNWTDALGTTSIKLRYRKVGDLVWTVTTIQEGYGSKLIHSLEGGTDYEWQMKTVCDMERSSAWSASQNFTTLDATIANGFCPTPTAFSTTNITATQAKLNWTPAGSVPFHKLRYRAVGGGGWTKYTVNAPANDKQLSGLTPNTNYEWQVKTTCALNNRSQWSALQNFTTAELCGPITGVMHSDITESTAVISWDTLSGVDGYKIRYKPTAGSDWTARFVAHPNDSRIIDELTGGTEYEYRVDLDCSTGDKVVGSLDTFTTAPPPRLASPNAIDEKGDEFGYSIYPNPNNGQFAVEAWGKIKGNVVISLTDVTGRILATRTWNADVEGRLELNTDLPSGVYLISIEANGARYNERLIINK